MSIPTSGIQVHFGSRVWRSAIELVSSMRFAIALLTLIALASVIGTVVKQNEPWVNVVNQFGPFWAQWFVRLGLTQIYSAWWFLLILAFLVLSTSLCIARNAPKIWRDLRQYKEHVRQESLASFHHHGQGVWPEPLTQVLSQVQAFLRRQGWRSKVRTQLDAQGQVQGYMVAARMGTVNKLGYIAAHSAIVLICVGGLFDGDVIVRLQMALQHKSSYRGEGLVRDVPQAHRLGPGTLSFRGQVAVSEGGRSHTALISQADGVVLQELPFEIELKKFIVDYYNTGMPKRFASEVILHDRDSGLATAVTIQVNEPAFHKGVAIYQSSFDDGGSRLKLRAWPMVGAGEGLEFDAQVGTRQPWAQPGAEPLTLEFTGFRPINVENLSAPAAPASEFDWTARLQAQLVPGSKNKAPKVLHNVGPSFSYKLRDGANQAREFNNYMQPVELDGQRVLLAGVRDTPDGAFAYLRIPVDEADHIDTWLALRQALRNPDQREQAVQRYVRANSAGQTAQTVAALRVLANVTLSLFAGDASAAKLSGLPALAAHLEKNVPSADRERLSGLMLRVLSSCLFEMLNAHRTAQKLTPWQGEDPRVQAFMTQALLALSDSMRYPAPVLLTLQNYEQVQASVFQVTRSPGKKWVYLGCIFLIIGVFAMLYIRERRLWVWLGAHQDGTQLKMAMSCTRRTLDFDAEFEQLKQTLLGAHKP